MRPLFARSHNGFCATTTALFAKRWSKYKNDCNVPILISCGTYKQMGEARNKQKKRKTPAIPEVGRSVCAFLRVGTPAFFPVVAFSQQFDQRFNVFGFAPGRRHDDSAAMHFEEAL